MILLDTNILIRIANRNDPDYRLTLTAVAGCMRKGRQLFVAAQALQEFWATATRAKTKNGLAMTPSRADAFLQRFLTTFKRLPDHEGLFDAWRLTVSHFSITGLHAYDARLAAFMQTHGLTRLMTYNAVDFAMFPIALVNPRDPSTW